MLLTLKTLKSLCPLREVLGNSNRTNLSNLTDLQREILARCWKNNIDFWTPDMKWLYGPMFFFSHWFYYRWKHGKKATIPMMRLAGFPVTQKINKQCDKEYCQNGFKEAFEHLRERFFDN